MENSKNPKSDATPRPNTQPVFERKAKPTIEELVAEMHGRQLPMVPGWDELQPVGLELADD